MPMYRYIKAKPNTEKHRNPVLSYILMALGIVTLIWVGGPILTFWLFTSPLLVKSVTPLPDKFQIAGGLNSRVLSSQIQENLTLDGDYTNPDIWFPSRPQIKEKTNLSTYTISIPKLNIKDANVIVGGDDLIKSLIHYGGTAYPGKYGNTVIFGHSTLVQFFNPKNYKSIFSTLPNLKKGDSVYVKSDGIVYRYVVFDMTVTEPNDVSALEQQFDDSYLTLITCVPPGTYLKRLNVKAKLEKI